MTTQRLEFLLAFILVCAVAAPWTDAHARGENALSGKQDSAESTTLDEATGADASSSLLRSDTGRRTIDALTDAELAKLREMEADYFAQIRSDALALVKIRFDVNTMLRIFPEQIRIIRQRKRNVLFNIERYLYSLRLNSDFVTSYVARLREDVLHYALDEMIKRSEGMNGLAR